MHHLRTSLFRASTGNQPGTLTLTVLILLAGVSRVDAIAFTAKTPHHYRVSNQHEIKFGGRAASRRWLRLAVGSFIFFWMVYAGFVWTRVGQTFENSALQGAKLDPSNILSVADEQLRVISVVSLALATLAVSTIGYVRAGWRLAAGGAGVVVISLGVAEVLKRYVLPRPNLVDAAEGISHNSFPSGHTTIAMSLLVAMIIVVPKRWRTLALLLTLMWATGIGALTVAADWHRLSDTLGSDALVLTVGSLVSMWLFSEGLVQPAAHKRGVFGTLFFWFVAILGVLSTALGILLAVLNSTRNAPGSEFFAINSYLASHTLAFAGSMLVAALFWASWFRLESGTAKASLA